MDQYVANAADKPDIKGFWVQLKQQELQNVDRLKALVSNEVREGCF